MKDAKEKIVKNIEKKCAGIALLKVKDTVKSSCASYDPFGLCMVHECLKCENSKYEIIIINSDENTNVYKSVDYDSKGKNEQIYLIEFMDYVPSINKFVAYLEEDENNYRLTRIFDEVVLRDCKKPIQKCKIININKYKNMNK